MSKGNGEKQGNEKPAQPEFKPQYFWAFAALMLYKIGGVETITLEQLEKFDAADCPTVEWNEEIKAFVMKNREMDTGQPKIITALPRKLRKQIAKNMVKNYIRRFRGSSVSK